MHQLTLGLPDQDIGTSVTSAENERRANMPPEAPVTATVTFGKDAADNAAPRCAMSEIVNLADNPMAAVIEQHATLPADTWTSAPMAAFEDWQKNTVSSEGVPYAPKSISQHCAMFHRFAQFLAAGNLVMQTITAPQIAVFLETLATKDGVPAIDATKQRYLKLLRATFDHLKRIGYRTTPNPCAFLSRFNRRELDVAPTSLDVSENDTFVNIVLAKEPESWRDCRDQAMLLLIIASGLKASEAINLQAGDIALDETPPFIRIPAHGKVPERVTPISTFAIEPLRHWLYLRTNMSLATDDTVFVTTQGGPMRPETLHRKCKAILGTHGDELRPHGGFGPQVLRNAFLVRQLANNKPLEVVQQWAGHVEPKSTARFKRLVVNPDGVEVS